MATSHKEPLTSAPSSSSTQQMSLGLDSGTSSPGSAGGPMHSDLPASPMTPTSGPGPARAKDSRTRARGAAFSTLDIFGQHGSHSSSSVALQCSLESRLRQRLDCAGSTLFSLTWNDAVTPSGRRICARRASVLRTPDSGCSSWPTPTVSRGDYAYDHGDHDAPRLKLAGAVWPTPTARDWKSSASNKHGDNARPLNEVARLATWATPAAQEAGGTPEAFLARKQAAREDGTTIGVSLTSLSLQAQLADSGPMPTGSCAGTPPADRRSPGQLNPEHSRWLQGYPAAWGLCGATVIRSSRK